MYFLICLFFYIIWAKLVYSPIPSLIFLMPFTKDFMQLIRLKKYRKPFILTMIFTCFIYSVAIIDYISNPAYTIAFFIIFFNFLLILNYLILKFISFVDFCLRYKEFNESLYIFIFYFLYFGYLTLCYISSETIIKLTSYLFQI